MHMRAYVVNVVNVNVNVNVNVFNLRTCTGEPMTRVDSGLDNGCRIITRGCCTRHAQRGDHLHKSLLLVLALKTCCHARIDRILLDSVARDGNIHALEPAHACMLVDIMQSGI